MRQPAKSNTPISSQVGSAEDFPTYPDRGWFAQSAQRHALEAAGIKVEGGGPHQSKTMMLAEVSALFSSQEDADLTDAVLSQNVLGNPKDRKNARLVLIAYTLLIVFILALQRSLERFV